MGSTARRLRRNVAGCVLRGVDRNGRKAVSWYPQSAADTIGCCIVTDAQPEFVHAAAFKTHERMRLTVINDTFEEEPWDRRARIIDRIPYPIADPHF